LPGRAELAVMGGTQAASLPKSKPLPLSQKEKSLMKPKKLNYSQNKSEIRRTGFLIMPHQDYGQMLLIR
jgi:hypothetical protein